MKSLKIVDAKLLYNKKTIAGLNGINLSISSPGLYAIQGQSGCGKTTLLEVINNEKKLDSGSVNHSDLKISKMPIIENINPSLKIIDILVEHNKLAFPELSHEKQINIARESLMLLEITNEINKPFEQLSSGQKQRVLIAIALCSKPDLLIMDEPFSIIDQNTRSSILKELKKIISNLKIIILWVTHDSHDVFEFADEIILMNFGKIVENNKPEHLYFYPTTLIGATYYGENNIFTCKYSDGMIDLPWMKLKKKLTNSFNQNILISIRPQLINILDKPMDNSLEVDLKNIHFKGSNYLIECSFESHTLFAISLIKPKAKKINLYLDPQLLHIIGAI